MTDATDHYVILPIICKKSNRDYPLSGDTFIYCPLLTTAVFVMTICRHVARVTGGGVIETVEINALERKGEQDPGLQERRQGFSGLWSYSRAGSII